MESYRISFFKTLLNSNGYPSKCLQHVVKIHRAKSAERAITAAKHRYARDYGVRNWQLYADTFEVEPSEGLGEPAHSAHDRARRRPAMRARPNHQAMRPGH